MKAHGTSGVASRTRLGVALLPLMAVVSGVAPLGCTQQKTPAPRRVQVGDFRSDLGAGGLGEASIRNRVEPGMVRLGPELGFDTGLGPRGTLSVEVVAGPPKPSTEPSPAAGPETFVEAKVGEINGTPVFASEFFDEQFARRLLADARTKPATKWQTDAADAIRAKLDALIQDALLTQEGRATLTPAEQQGLLFFLNRWERNRESEFMGSKQAYQRALGAQGRSAADDRERRERLLLQAQVLRPLVRTIQITPADISRTYRQDYHQYHYGVVQFRQIQVRTDQPDDVAAVSAELEKGTPFEEVASREWNGYRRDTAGLRDEMRYTGDYETAELFSQPPLNTAAQSLALGEWVGPVSVNGTLMVWLYSDLFERTDITQYEAQLHIGAELWTLARAEVVRRYVDRLRNRASFTDEQSMAEQLLVIATERFYLPNSG